MKMPAFVIVLTFLFISCSQKKESRSINVLAEKYVRLGLTIGSYDPDFVDAYYGPDSLKPKTVADTAAKFPVDSLLNAVSALNNELNEFTTGEHADRAKWMQQQLKAFHQRIRIFGGEYVTFKEEAFDLFGVNPPQYREDHFKGLLSRLDSLLPGEGDVSSRYHAFARKFIIPKGKIDTVFRTAIAEARKRTLAHYQLPANENFRMEYVTGKSWSGYNWYQGNFQSLIQISTDTDIFIERAIDLACHEGYPGHHVYNLLLEKNLYKDKGWVEISLYPLFSPQSLIAEGSANYGIELAFPGTEGMDYARDVLLPVAGLDTTGISFYFQALSLKSKLNFARNEVARGLLEGNMNESEAMRWLTTYNLFTEETAKKSISFIRKYRTYVINYNYGLELVRNYIGSRSGSEEERWKVFGELLSRPVLSKDLK